MCYFDRIVDWRDLRFQDLYSPHATTKCNEMANPEHVYHRIRQTILR